MGEITIPVEEYKDLLKRSAAFFVLEALAGGGEYGLSQGHCDAILEAGGVTVEKKNHMPAEAVQHV